jgi:hypothetical protein
MIMALALPTIQNTKRHAIVQSKKPDRFGRVSNDRLAVPDSVTDVQTWLDRVFGNYDLIELQ